MIEFDIAITISIALFVGLIAQSIAYHLRIPGIVLLLLTGAFLGPEGAKIIDPLLYHESLQMLVGFAVAVILFEGGLSLDLKRLKKESKAIRQLVTLGAGITIIGAMIAAHYILSWSWQMSFLFGTLVSVTGPTVVGPLLKRIKLRSNLKTVLEAEGLLSDPIGALVAIVALEVIVQPNESSFLSGILHLFMRLGFGAIIGVIGGFLLAFIIKPKKLIPTHLKNIFVLTFVLALYHISNYLQPESGIGAVTVAGIVVGNFKNKVLHELVEFKEQLTSMFIAMLFVLLAADVKFIDIQTLGISGLIVVGVLMFVIRPMNVFASTIGTDLKFKEKLFLSWLAPRGIVAAAVASFFAVTLDDAGIEGGALLRALVFMVIAVTVTVQGISGSSIARLLKVSRKTNVGYAILGANLIAIELAKGLRECETEILFIDTNSDAVRNAEELQFKVLFGNALDDNLLARGSISSMKGCIAMTPNEEINLIFIKKVHTELKVESVFMPLHISGGYITDEMVDEAGGNILFGVKRDLDLWNVRLRKKTAKAEYWISSAKESTLLVDSESQDAVINKVLLPLVRIRDKKSEPVIVGTKVKSGDKILFLVFEEQRTDANKWFAHEGWVYHHDDMDSST